MGLLSALLPGLREARTPFAVGAVYLSALLVLFGARFDEWGLKQYEALWSFLADLPEVLLLSALSFTAYLLGLVLYRANFVYYVTRDPIFLRIPLRLRRHVLPAGSVRARLIIESTVEERTRATLPGWEVPIPAELIASQFRLSSVRLSKDAPDQFQQWDRTMAESEFRAAIPVPLMAFFLVLLGVMSLDGIIELWAAFLLYGLAVLAANALIHAGRRSRGEADELLATALYYGYTSTPLMDALLDDASALVKRHPARDAALDTAWLVGWLVRRDLWQAAFKTLDGWWEDEKSKPRKLKPEIVSAIDLDVLPRLLESIEAETWFDK